MNQQPTITELIETISQSLEADGITAEYIKQLSYTWNVLKRYFSEHDLFFSKESGIMFLEEIYGISSVAFCQKYKTFGSIPKFV